MADWNVEFHPPHYHPGKGGWYVGDFYVSRSKKDMPKPVQVKLTYRAQAVFAAALPGRAIDFMIREYIIARWGEETIRKWLNAGRSLPDSFTLGTQPSDDPAVYQLVSQDAQELLKRWGLRG